MVNHLKLNRLLPVMIVLVLMNTVRAEKLAKVEIAKIGKAATAFVETPNRGSGTAFCIHASGLYSSPTSMLFAVRIRGAVTLVLKSGVEDAEGAECQGRSWNR